MILKLLGWAVPLFAVPAVAARTPTGKYYVGLGTYFVALAVCSTWGVFVSIGMSVIGRRFDINYVIARSFYLLGGALTGIKIVVEGEEHLSNRPVVFVGNHQSMLDILYLGRILPKGCSIMAKKELQWTPLLGQFMTLSGAVFINRSSNKDAVKSLAQAGETMKERSTSIWIFPEGTRTQKETPHLLPFKKGAFHLAVQAGIPIVPVVCENYWHLYRKNVFESGVLKVRVLPPIPTANLKPEDVNDLAVRTHELMLDALCALSPDHARPAAPETSQVVSEVPTSGAAPEIQVRSPAGQGSVRDLGLRQRKEGSTGNGEEVSEEDEEMVIVSRPS